MKVLVVGANGQIGKHLVAMIQKNDHLEARAMIRDQAQASLFEDLGKLRATDMDHTIIHPGLLTNDKGNGNVEAATTVERGEIPREDVAHVILACLENDATIGKEFQVVGGDQAVDDTVHAL